MAGNKMVLKVVGVAAAAFLLSGCSGSDAKPEWQVAISQSTEVSEETVALLDKYEPQFKTDKFSATFVPLGERMDTAENKKVATFAVSANLPSNCLEKNGKDIAPDDGSGSCLDFMYGAATERVEQDGKDYKLPLNSSVETAFFETAKGVSVVEISSPADTANYIVNFVADGESVMFDPVTGEILNDNSSEVTPSPSESAK